MKNLRVLFICILGLIATCPTHIMGLGTFTEPFVKFFQLTHTQLSTTYLCTSILAGIIAPLAGNFYDKRGAKFCILFSFFSIGSIFCLLSFFGKHVQASSLKEKFFYLAITYFVLQAVGQGLLLVTCRSYFVKNIPKGQRGILVALQDSIMVICISCTPSFFLILLSKWNWIKIWNNLSLVYIFLFPVIIIYLFAKQKNKGGCRNKTEEEKEVKPIFLLKNKKEIIFHSEFWLFAISLILPPLLNSSICFHLEDFCSDIRILASNLGKYFIYMSLIVISFEFFFGYLSKRIPIRFMFLTLLTSQVFYLLGLFFITNTYGLIAFLIGGGASWALFGILVQNTWIVLYGKKYLGFIVGLTVSLIAVANAFGPFVMSCAKNIFGSYSYGLFINVLILALLFTGLIFLFKKLKAKNI